jgi:hypothetical protein
MQRKFTAQLEHQKKELTSTDDKRGSWGSKIFPAPGPLPKRTYRLGKDLNAEITIED